MAPREAIRAMDMAPSDSRVMKVLQSGSLPMWDDIWIPWTMDPLADCGFRDAEAFPHSAYAKTRPERSNYISLCAFSILRISFAHAPILRIISSFWIWVTRIRLLNHWITYMRNDTCFTSHILKCWYFVILIHFIRLNNENSSMWFHFAASPMPTQ